MTGTEWLVVPIAAAGGYWLVSFLMKGAQARKAEPASGQAVPTPAEPGPSPWWEVLGISQQASVEDIRAAYRSQIAQYHPDKVATLGPEIREVAHRKSQEITEAYQKAVQVR